MTKTFALDMMKLFENAMNEMMTEKEKQGLIINREIVEEILQELKAKL